MEYRCLRLDYLESIMYRLKKKQKFAKGKTEPEYVGMYKQVTGEVKELRALIKQVKDGKE